MWRATKPTVGGYYWVRRADQLVRGVAMATVAPDHDGCLRARCHWWSDSIPVQDLVGYLWHGPVGEAEARGHQAGAP